MNAADVLNWLGTVVLCSVSYWIAFQRGRRYEANLQRQSCQLCKQKRDRFLKAFLYTQDAPRDNSAA